MREEWVELANVGSEKYITYDSYVCQINLILAIVLREYGTFPPSLQNKVRIWRMTHTGYKNFSWLILARVIFDSKLHIFSGISFTFL